MCAHARLWVSIRVLTCRGAGGGGGEGGGGGVALGFAVVCLRPTGSTFTARGLRRGWLKFGLTRRVGVGVGVTELL